MKVVAFNGSARKDGNTAILIRTVFKELEAAGIETELVQLAGKPVHGCIACRKCFDSKNSRCTQTGDIVNDCIAKMSEADGIIFGSPTYFANITPEIKALMDRAGFVARANENLLAKKVGASVIAVRRTGAIHAFNSLNLFFLITQMIIPGSSYWNVGFGREPGDVEKDEEGMQTMRTLGRNMAWLLEKVRG